MKRTYRIIKRLNLFYPQVSHRKFLFTFFKWKLFFYWTEWNRIGVHNNGFGLYGADNWDYGGTLIEADSITKKYEQWVSDSESALEEVVLKTSDLDIRISISRRKLRLHELKRPVFKLPND